MAVKAIQPATNLALGLHLKIKIPLTVIPKPITRIPPIPVDLFEKRKKIETMLMEQKVVVCTRKELIFPT